DMTDLMHFKFTHNGSWHRFVLPTRGGRKVFRRFKKRLLTVLGVSEQSIWWDDGETINCLIDSIDLAAAIAFAEQEGRLLNTVPCVYIQLEAIAQFEETKPVSEQITSGESADVHAEAVMEQRQTNSHPLPDNLSSEEKRLAHLGFLPCTASSATQAASPAVPSVVSVVPSSLQHLVALTEALSKTLPNAAAMEATAPAGSLLDAASSLRAAKVDLYRSKMLEQGYGDLGALSASLAKAEALADTDAAEADDEHTMTITPCCGFYRYIPSSAYNGSIVSEVEAAPRAAEEPVPRIGMDENSEEKKKQWEAEMRAIEEKEDPVLAHEEAAQPADNTPPSPVAVPLERSLNYDQLVQNWTRIGEESKGDEDKEASAAEALPASTVEIPTTESVFALCAAAAEELYGADSFAAAQIAVLRDARRPTPPGMAAAQRSIGPLTEYEQERRGARYEEAKRWMADTMATSAEGPMWMAPAADAPASSAWTSADDYLKTMDELDAAAAAQ
ncbi:hypothetical protein PRIPAC_90117, partial [Pristionchus pacificus]